MSLAADNPFASPVVEAAAHEAVFGSRYPNLLYRIPETGRAIGFQNYEYRTADESEIRFLLGMCETEARNKAVFLRALPPTWGAAPEEAPAPAAPAPTPKTPRRRGGA